MRLQISLDVYSLLKKNFFFKPVGKAISVYMHQFEASALTAGIMTFSRSFFSFSYIESSFVGIGQKRMHVMTAIIEHSVSLLSIFRTMPSYIDTTKIQKLFQKIETITTQSSSQQKEADYGLRQ